MRTGGLSITHTNVTDTFQWPGASLLSSTNVRLSAVMSELEIVANGPSSDPVQHFTVLGVQGNNGLGGRCVLMCVGMFLQLPRLLIDEVDVRIRSVKNPVLPGFELVTSGFGP
jgi:hypothetical protein